MSSTFPRDRGAPREESGPGGRRSLIRGITSINTAFEHLDPWNCKYYYAVDPWSQYMELVEGIGFLTF